MNTPQNTPYKTNYARQSKIKHYKTKARSLLQTLAYQTGIKQKHEVNIMQLMPHRQLPTKVN